MKMGQRKEAVLKKIENNDVRAVSLASCIALLQTQRVVLRLPPLTA